MQGLVTDEDSPLVLSLLGKMQLFYLYPSCGKLCFVIFSVEMWSLETDRNFSESLKIQFWYMGTHSSSSEHHRR